jgi:hypothetical protein
VAFFLSATFFWEKESGEELFFLRKEKVKKGFKKKRKVRASCSQKSTELILYFL